MKFILPMRYIIILFLYLFSLSVTAQTIEQDTLAAKQLISKAKKDFNKEQYKEALELTDQAIELSKKYKPNEYYTSALLVKADCYYSMRDYANAEAFVNLALEDAPKLADKSYFRRANILLGSINRWQGKFEKAVQYFDVVLGDEAAGMELDELLLGAVMEKGACLDYLGNYEGALNLFEQGLEIGKALYPDTLSRNMGTIYNSLGIAYYRNGEYHKAIDYIRKNMEVVELNEDENNLKKGNTYSNLGVMSTKVNDFEGAINFYKQSIACYDRVGEEKKKSNTYNNMGVALRQMGRYEDAIVVYNKALTIDKKYYKGIDPNLARDYQNLGALYYAMLDYDKAMALTEKSLAIRLKIHTSGRHPELAEIYGNMAKFSIKKNNFEIGLSYILKSMRANSSDYDETDIYASALDYTQNYNIIDLSNFHTNIEQRTELFVAWYKLTKDVKMLDYAYTNNKAVVSYLMQYLNKISDVADKLELLKTLSNFQKKGVEIVSMLYEASGDEKYIEEAFQFSESSKTVLLLEALKSDKSLRFGEVPDSLLHKEAAYKQDLEKLEGQLSLAMLSKDQAKIKEIRDQIFDKREARTEILTELEASYPRYFNSSTNFEVVTEAALLEKLPDDKTAFLEYYISDTTMFLFVGTKTTGLQYCSIPYDSTKRILLHNFISDLGDLSALKEDTEVTRHLDFGKNAHALYQWLLAPCFAAIENIESIDRLIIVPDDLLSQLPFEALIMSAAPTAYSSSYYKELDYLLHRYQVSYSYSGTLLLENMKQMDALNKVESKGILAFAPSYNQDSIPITRSRGQRGLRSKLDDLPAATDEVKRLEALYKGTYIYGLGANEKTYKKEVSDHQIIHLAMHGIFEKGRPLASGLAFSEDADTIEDNFLYAYEISQMNSNAKLVVLSACETGVGEWKRGEGVMSLARSFMYSGVPSLVVSLWQVNDQATSILMQYYYNYLSKGSSKDKALQLAKQQYLKSVNDIAAHPAFWAAFIQLGNVEPLYVAKARGFWYYGRWGLGALGLGLLAFFIWKRRM